MFVFIAVGISRSLRSAAVIGLSLCIADFIAVCSKYGIKRLILPAIVIAMLTNSVRGTFWLAEHSSTKPM